MLSYFKLATATLLTLITISFAQDVTLSIDGTSLNYESSADIYGWQFDHDGCASGASGGASVDAGFMISCSESICLGFSLTGSFVSLGSGTLVDLGGECSTLSGFVFAGEGGSSLDVELSDGGGDPVLPTVSILSPTDGSSFDDAASVDVEVSCTDCGEGDHYHAFLDGAMQGMFYTDNFSLNVGYGDHTLTVTLADAGHQEYGHDGSSASVSFSVIETSAGGCDDPSACNDGDPNNDCTYAEENYDCDGNCTVDVDCNGDCGGSAVEDECGECGGGGASMQDCWFDGDGDGCYETLDPILTCSCEFEGGSSTGGDCGSDTSNVDVLYCSDADIYGFQFLVNGVTVLGASGGAAEANGFSTSAGNNTVLGFSFSGTFIPGNTCDILTTLEVEGDASAACLSDLVLSGENGSNLGDEITDCLTVTYTEPACDDADADGICDDVDDCVGEFDECGECNGDGIDEGSCDCDGNVADCAGACGGDAVADCAGECGGDAVVDECGECNGDGSSCGETSNVSIMYESDADIYGFQFAYQGEGDLISASGGDADLYGFTVSSSSASGVVLGFSFSGSFIPAGSGVLTNLEVTGSTGCIENVILSGSGGAALESSVDCILITVGDDDCEDVDADGICDDVDDCVGGLDCAGECNGSSVEDDCGVCDGGNVDDLGCGCFEPGPSGCDNACGSTAVDDACGVCGGDNSSCADCAGVPNGDAVEDECGVCNGDGTSCGDDHIDLSFGVIADGSMEILMTNTMAISGFQFNVTGVELDGASGGRAADAGFEVNTGVDGIVLGFSFTGGEIPVGSGVLTNLSFSALSDEACITNEVLALGEWSGGFYAINIGDCAAIDYSAPSSTADVLYSSDSDISGFQFHVDGDVTVTGVSGGAAEAAGFTVSTGNNNVLGFSLTGSVVSAGTGTLLTLEYTGDGSPCLSDLILSDPDANGLDATIEDCLTISYEAPCDDVDADGICDDVDDCVGTLDCAGECNGAAVVDDCGVCDGGNADDLGCGCFEAGPSGCDNECGSTAVVDDCGVCDGGNADMDCAGECGGSAEEDECGVCGGDGSSCAPGVYGLSLNEDGNLDVTFDSSDDIYGFQFNVSAVTVTGASGGAAADAGFTTSTGNNTVLGFSFSGSFIPAGSGVLTVLSFEGLGEACLSAIVVSGLGGSGLDAASGDCATIEDDCPSGDYDCAGVCDGAAVEDCAGDCGGDAVLSGCDNACNSTAVEDCAGDCGGDAVLSGCDNACNSTAVEDCAGVCGGDAVLSGCDDACNSTAVEDCAGVCGGDAVLSGCDDACNSTAVEDCAGVCGGDAVEDECGECGGDGIADGACDCAGSVEDCAGECGGTAENCPDWVDCAPCYENTASMTAIVLDALSGDQMYDENDILAAFDADGNVRGIALHLYPVPFGPYEGTGLYEMQIRGDAAGDAISFKYYDASEDEVLDSGTGYTFVIDDIIGSAVEPHEISVGAITLSIDIASGWNWFSLNVEGDMGIGSVMASLTSTEGDFIKSASASSTYYPDFGWYGGLDELGVIGMYKFNSANADLLVFSGAPVDPLSTPIDLASGWNWLGFTPQNDGATVDALATITTTEGDFIKNQGASSTYYSDFGWYGGLEVMAPTEGYMLSVAEGSTLTYPNFGADDALTRAKSEKELPVAVSNWEVDYHDYEFNGHITMSIDSREDFYGDYVAAFVGDECRGVAERMYFPFGDSYMYSVMVYSNLADGEELRFKYYDSAIGEIVEYAETIDFTSDMIVGDGFNTYSLSSETSDMQQPMTYGISDAYPNPFNPVTSFEYTIPEDGMVQVAVYDLNGRMVSELVNGYQAAGSYPVVWDAQELSSGVYMVNMISGDYSTIQKVMLIK